MELPILERVTITGADNQSDPHQIVDICLRHPRAELGILLSLNHTLSSVPCQRFPTLAWLRDLARAVEESRQEILISAHLCGAWVEQIIQCDDCHSPLDEWSAVVDTGLPGLLSRWQLNTHGRRLRPGEDFRQRIADLCHDKRQVIFQRDGQNEASWKICLGHGLDVAILHDKSGGAGITPSSWDFPEDDLPNGYAGGLGPDNVKTQLDKITPLLRPGQLIWIDAETRLRTRRNELDLDLVERFLDATGPYLHQAPERCPHGGRDLPSSCSLPAGHPGFHKRT